MQTRSYAKTVALLSTSLQKTSCNSSSKVDLCDMHRAGAAAAAFAVAAAVETYVQQCFLPPSVLEPFSLSPASCIIHSESESSHAQASESLTKYEVDKSRLVNFIFCTQGYQLDCWWKQQGTATVKKVDSQ